MENSSVKSSSSGVSDSWLFVKNIDEDEIRAGKNPEGTNKTTEELEDSDGISIISESEMNKEQHSDIEVEKGQIAEEIDHDENFEAQDDAKNNQDGEKIEDSILLTPPCTPNNMTEEEQKLQINTLEKYEEKASKENETAKCHKSSHGVMLLIGMSLIIAILYTNVTSMKNELAKTVSVYEQRILRLEEENQDLRTQLDELIRKMDKSIPYTKDDDIIIESLSFPQNIRNDQSERDRRPPVTKDVWLGGEKEEVVKVLDKKYNSLPDYCYFTDEDDLFYEYNLENCEKKKQKMEERIKKLNEKQDKHKGSIDYMIENINSDSIYKSNDNYYKDFLSKTADEILKAFDDEIQEIKSRRFTTSLVNDENLNAETFDKDEENKQKVGDGFVSDGKSTQFKNDEPVNQERNNFEGAGKQKRKRNQKGNNFDMLKNQQKRPKSSKRREGESEDDWIERRSSGRENARMKKESEENWYLKRKNDREIYRISETLGN